VALDAGPAVAIDGLVKRYGAVTAVDGLSLRMPRASILALLGPNGAGKTSTVEVCEGLHRADGGRVRVLGLDPVDDARRLRPRVGVMLQDGGGYPGAHAEELLRLFAGYARRPLDVDLLLDALGLRAVARTAYRRLSGGERQRLALATALVSRPELVFLDEPSAGMDPQARRALWDVVAALRSDGVSVVLTTHYIEEAERLADHVVVIDHGRVVAAGSPRELTDAGTDAELAFHAPADLDIGALRGALPGGPRVEHRGRGDYAVHGPVDPHLVAALTAWCAGADVLIDDLRVRRRSLEDVFLALTGDGAAP